MRGPLTAGPQKSLRQVNLIDSFGCPRGCRLASAAAWPLIKPCFCFLSFLYFSFQRLFFFKMLFLCFFLVFTFFVLFNTIYEILLTWRTIMSQENMLQMMMQAAQEIGV